MAGILALLLVSGACAADSRVIRVGVTMPKGMQEVAYINGMFEQFKAQVEANSRGSLRVQIYYGGVLGKPDERLNQVRRNVIQMSDAAEGNYATIHRDIQVFSIPYLFASVGAARHLLDGPVGSRVAEDIRASTGIRVLGWFEAAGFKHYSANTPLRSVADFQGKKLRVMSAVFSIPLAALGGTAIPIPMNELYLSLKTGVVDGQDNAVAVFNMQKLYEVQDYITLDAHTYSFGPLGINESFFQSLSEEEREIVRKAGSAAVTWNRTMSERIETRAIAQAEQHDVTLIRLTPEMRRTFAARAQPAVIDWLRSNIDTPGLIEDVLTEAQRLNGTDG